MLQKLFDENDPIAEAYTLEVSSPGIFRVLKNPEHFRRFTGERIKIRLEKKITECDRQLANYALQQKMESNSFLKMKAKKDCSLLT